MIQLRKPRTAMLPIKAEFPASAQLLGRRDPFAKARLDAEAQKTRGTQNGKRQDAIRFSGSALLCAFLRSARLCVAHSCSSGFSAGQGASARYTPAPKSP